jgi:predicted DNA-binding transcriptional regulator AlpA
VSGRASENDGSQQRTRILKLEFPDDVIEAIATSVAAKVAATTPPQTQDAWQLLNVEDVAGRLGRSTRWVRERVKRGDLPYVRLDGGAFAFELSDVQDFAIERRIDVRDEAVRRLRAL